MSYRTPLLMLVAFAVSGCVTVPETLEGEYAEEPLPQAVTADQRDRPVRWGGLVYSTWSEEDGSCMELVARPLDRWYRPDFGKVAAGRFVACRDEPLDPEEFFPGRDVTVVGVLERFAEAQVDDEVQVFPVVRAGTVHAWPLPALFQQGPERNQQDRQGQHGIFESNRRAADRLGNR